MPYSHFLAKLSPKGGPDPSEELRNILEQCRRSPEHQAWFATYHRGLDFCRAGNSLCIIFHQPDRSNRIEAIIARVLSQSPPPDGAPVREYYHRWQDRLKYWWNVGGKRPGATYCDLVLTQFESLDAIPGHSSNAGLPARETFVGRAAFAGWTFEDKPLFDPLKWLQDLPGTHPIDGLPADSSTAPNDTQVFRSEFLDHLARGVESISDEIAFYQQHLSQWGDHEGKHVLIKDGAEHGFYTSREEAVREGYRRFGRVPFLVHQVLLEEKPGTLSWAIR